MLEKIRNNCIYFDQCQLCHLTDKGLIHGLCQECYNDLPWLADHCQRCALPISHSGLCGDCLNNPPPFQRTHALFEYRFPIQQMIQQAKFSQQTHWLGALGLMMADSLKDFQRPDLVIPLPLHQTSLRQRGYNQAELLASVIATELNCPLDNRRLAKKLSTTAQHSLKKAERMQNLKGCFISQPCVGASIALVDDIMTTGSTLREASSTLKSAGASNIQCWVVARTPSD